MATSIDTRRTDFSEMDNAGISKEHWKIMFISGVHLLPRILWEGVGELFSNKVAAELALAAE